ncbi:hypothetical protein Ddye_000541 [Dipteronia dyeriana]|uniref:Uncharacterized protein n=1 Tax=Dipteronia dyeriana TaxID=168575 RepID=A0AAD9XMM3_9ROSI|nr:hypothetical protein Ddye_000541 [Dipteronia dyeriana]
MALPKGDFMPRPLPFDMGVGPSQQRPECVNYMLLMMKRYIDIGLADLKKKMKEEMASFDARFVTVDPGTGRQQHDGADPIAPVSGYDTGLLSSDGD